MLKVKDTYLYCNDAPFFYLGDTAWLLLYKMSEEDIIKYLKNRKSLGFNVIQSVLVYAVNGVNTSIHSDGRDCKTKEYWHFVKKIVKYAEGLGLYFGLLPSWGNIIKEGIINSNNVEEYASFLIDFFSDCNNIIWIIGGDVRGDVAFDVFDKLGSLLKSSTNSLVTFHPFGRTGSYLWFNDCEWLDFNMFQSGHRRYDQLKMNAWDDKSMNEDSFGEDNYKYVNKSKTYKIIKPILDGEPSYEGIVQGLHDFSQPYWEACDVRRYLYWSVLAGACGFTYGHNAIMQFYEYGQKGNYGVRETWREALNAPGAAQMQYLKNLFIEFDFTKGKPLNIVLDNKEKYLYTSSFGCEDFIICYNYLGISFKLDLTKYNNKYECYWMNPQNDSKSYFDTIDGGNVYEFKPIRRREMSNDWVLILKRNN